MSDGAQLPAELEPPLPELLSRMAEVCGSGAALVLAARFGGRRLYIPAPENIGEEHPIAQAIGLAAARKAAEALGPGHLIVPLGPASTYARQHVAIRRMKAEGCTNAEIAANLGIHLRTVERHVSPTRRVPDLRQGSLFPD